MSDLRDQTMRKRFVSEIGTRTTSSFSSEDDEAIDLDRASLFRPTKIYYIRPHSIFTFQPKIIDLTDGMKKDAKADSLQSHSFRVEAQKLAETLADRPLYTINRQSWHHCFHFSVRDGADAVVAEWSHPVFSCGAASIDFSKEAAGAEHSTHGIVCKPAGYLTRSSRFVADSATYEWACRSSWSAREIRLWKSVGAHRECVAVYTEDCKFATGGPLMINTDAVDDAVAAITCCVELKRKRQRRYEQRRLGGAGGLPS